ncbi:MAG: inorganic diphosphatase [Rickettsiales bacterium]|nr:inorganic diphosphatase [Rickettsiales bacterium]
MDLKKISAGSNIPEQINVLIEISAGANPVKYEFDKDSGAILVDRFLTTAMFYPANYGFIPHTLSDDGDPADVLVLSDNSIIPGAVVECRPIGVLMMEDEKGQDEKILAVPIDKIHPFTKDIKDIDDVDSTTLERLKHFFERYKDLESGKWAKVTGFENKAKACEIIKASIK